MVKLKIFSRQPNTSNRYTPPSGGADFEVNGAEYAEMTPAFSSYLNLEDFATLKTIDGTYDMICVDKSTGVGAERFLARMPPYLAAPLYLTSGGKHTSDRGG